jgi:uncharacterized protein (TIGR00369 family)
MTQQTTQKKVGQTVPFISRTGLEFEKMDKEGIRLKMPLAPNINHIGIMYAGALWTLAETMGGAAYQAYLALEGTFPIVKALNIKFLRPALSGITCDYRMDPAEAVRVRQECEEKGKANFDLSLELKDAKGEVVAVTEGFYQVRKGTGL